MKKTKKTKKTIVPIENPATSFGNKSKLKKTFAGDYYMKDISKFHN